MSGVPTELSVYHDWLARGKAAQTALPALEAYWRAFQYYLEPQPMAAAMERLQAWPELLQAWQVFAALWYPESFQQVLDSEPTIELNHLVSGFPPALIPWQQFLFPVLAPRLSVCMIVRNEALVLKQALDSVSELADEIILVDTGSEDQSPQIAQAYPKLRWFSLPWQDDFSLARNFSLQQAQGDWILVLDADEVLDAKSQAYLRRLLAYAPLGWQSAAVQIRHQLATETALSWAPRIFRAQPAQIRYTGALHELPVKQSSPHFLLTLFLPVCFQHSGSQREAQLSHQKSRRVEILKKMVSDPQRVNPYARYHYAYVLFHGIDSAQNVPQAEQLFGQALQETLQYHGRLAPAPDWLPAPLPGVLIALAQVYIAQQRWQELLRLYARFRPLCPYASFSQLAAQAAQASGQWALARQLLLHSYAPALYQLQASSDWQTTVLENLLELALQERDVFGALFAVRRLLELAPDGSVIGKDMDLWALHADLHQLLTVPIGAWLDRLYFELEHAQTPVLRLLFSWWILCETWSYDALMAGLQAAQDLNAQAIVMGLLKLGRACYGRQFGLNFEAVFSDESLTQLDFDALHSLPGGSHWQYLLTPPLQRPRVSLCMIVRNGENRILEALQSVAGLVDEYIIADTGSEDQTLAQIQEWAQTHPVRFLELQWQDDFAWARNQTLAAASGDWVLVLDADEVLSPESLPILKRLLAYRPQGLQVLTCICESYFDDARRNQRVRVARLFANHAFIRFRGRLHEQLCHARWNESLPVQNLAGVTLKHWGYLDAEMHKHRKQDRSRLLIDTLQVEGLPNPYYLYHYGYALLHNSQLADPERGLAYLLQSIELSEHYVLAPVRGWFRAPVARVRLILFRYWFQQGADAELLHYYLPWQDQVQDAEFHYLLGATALKLDALELAKTAFMRCLTAEPAARFALPFGDRLPWQGLIQVALKQGDWALGVSVFQHWIAQDIKAQREYLRWWQAMLQAHI